MSKMIEEISIKSSSEEEFKGLEKGRDRFCEYYSMYGVGKIEISSPCEDIFYISPKDKDSKITQLRHRKDTLGGLVSNDLGSCSIQLGEYGYQITFKHPNSKD